MLCNQDMESEGKRGEGGKRERGREKGGGKGKEKKEREGVYSQGLKEKIAPL